MDFPLLSAITFAPLIGALLIFFLPNVTRERARAIALAASAVSFVLSIWLLGAFDKNAEFQFVEHVSWLKGLGASYHMGVDGMAVLLIVLTTLLTVISISWSWNTITFRAREYYIAILLLETGMLGVFMALDLFVFYIFWEVMLIPMALLIGVWGSSNRVYAAIKFFIYTLFGSLLMLVGIVATYQAYFRQDRRAHARHSQAAAGLVARSVRQRLPGFWSSRPSSSPSRSRCRCSRSTPGCRTPTSRRRPPHR